jgi:hypothetical protein
MEGAQYPRRILPMIRKSVVSSARSAAHNSPYVPTRRGSSSYIPDFELDISDLLIMAQRLADHEESSSISTAGATFELKHGWAGTAATELTPHAKLDKLSPE